jgi:hypothetical protein
VVVALSVIIGILLGVFLFKKRPGPVITITRKKVQPADDLTPDQVVDYWEKDE